mgnify:CR=1 FL=1
MEQIKINDEVFSITEIMPVTPNVIRIVFCDKVPIKWGEITTWSIGGVKEGEKGGVIVGYETVYRDEGQTVYLSDDGNVYVAPETSEGPGEPPEPYVPTLDELQAAKRREVAADCEQIIYAGVNVTLADGSVEHYALTIEDQLNLFGKQIQVSAGQAQIEYHADGQPFRYYTAADMQAIIQAAMWHVSYHTTYCNALNMWIAGVGTAEELQAVFYGADVTPEYQSDVLQAYLIEIAALAGGDGNVDPA